MPTPFTHLTLAARMLDDRQIPSPARQALAAELGAFLLGNIAADARVASGSRREATHFYAFDRPIEDHPWRVMLRDYPALARPTSAAQRAFIAGYVAHLTVDEVWTLEMVRPYFAGQAWASPGERFLMLNVLLISLDERDYARLPDWERATLLAAEPRVWLPFMTADDLCGWRDFVGVQLPPGGISQTLAVIGERVGQTPAALRALLDSPEQLRNRLWAHVPHAAVAETEARMYACSRDDLMSYLEATGV